MIAIGDPATERVARVGSSLVTVGAFTYGIHRLVIREWGEGAALRIGRYCSLADGVEILLGGQHRTEWITTFPFGHVFQDQLGGREITGHPWSRGDVDIGHDVWIGSGATVISGVRIGSGAVIATNSHVTRDVQPYEIVGGNPARHLKFRFSQETIDALLELRWWDLAVDQVRQLAADLSGPPDAQRLRRIRDALASKPQGVAQP